MSTHTNPCRRVLNRFAAQPAPVGKFHAAAWAVCSVGACLGLGALLPVVGVGHAQAQSASFVNQQAAAPLMRRFDQATVDQALAIVKDASQSDRIGMRANAAEAIANVPDVRLPMLELALRDDAGPVRFAALLAIGKNKLTELGPAAAKLQNDPDANVRGAAVFAAKRTGQPAKMDHLATMAMSPDVTVRSNAYLLLGRLEDPSAVGLLKAAGRNKLGIRVSDTRRAICDLQLAEALARLGDDEGLRAIRAAMFEKDPEQQVFAVTIFGDLEDRTFMAALGAMVSNHREDLPELSVAAATSMAKLGDPGGLDRLVEAAEQNQIEWNGKQYPADTIQAQAAFGLGQIDDIKANQALAKLLEDDHVQVRLSAAAAILQAVGPKAF